MQAIPIVLGYAQFRQQGAAGKYNQAVQNRNAQIAEQEAQQLEKQLEFDLVKQDEKFIQAQGKAKTSILKSGVDLDGTAFKILRRNAEQNELQKDIMTYNNQVAQNKKREEANFFTIQGNIARQTSRMAQVGTLFQTGTSLLTMGTPSVPKIPSQYNPFSFDMMK